MGFVSDFWKKMRNDTAPADDAETVSTNSIQTSQTDSSLLVSEIEQNWTEDHTRMCAERFAFVPSTAVEEAIEQYTNEFLAALGEKFLNNGDAHDAMKEKVREAYKFAQTQRKHPNSDNTAISDTRHKLMQQSRTISVQTYTRGKDREVFDIPHEIVELLWFEDGPLKNYDSESVGTEQEVGYGIYIKTYMTTDIEPSLISSQCLVKKPEDRLFLPPIGYYPTYGALSDEQRWVYWNWLHNIDDTTDIGNVFIFYYGLERRLFTKDYQKAFDMVLRLKLHHANNSFQLYSSHALLGAILYHKDWDLYAQLEQVDKTCGNSATTPLYMFVRYFVNAPLTANDVMALSSEFGFKNRRYINEYPELFSEIMSQKMTDRYGTRALPFSFVDIKKCPLVGVQIVANLSLSIRNINVSKVLADKQLHSEANSLLTETHESVKLKLREMRKHGAI